MNRMRRVSHDMEALPDYTVFILIAGFLTTITHITAQYRAVGRAGQRGGGGAAANALAAAARRTQHKDYFPIHITVG